MGFVPVFRAKLSPIFLFFPLRLGVPILLANASKNPEKWTLPLLWPYGVFALLASVFKGATFLVAAHVFTNFFLQK